jgi:predicted GNAT superfamily acetyltransferase
MPAGQNTPRQRHRREPRGIGKHAEPAPPLHLSVRHCRGLADFAACMEIERAVWGGADADLVPLPIFVIASETGGQVLGAFDGDRMIGFTLAIAGLRRRKPFLHSHMTAVLEAYRNRGAGRRLKLFQRENTLAGGVELIEWTFDPLELRNAYFNFRLGIIVRRFLPNFYGVTTSPLHGGLPTDRLVAEWWLRSARVRRSLAGQKGPKGIGAPRSKKKVARIRVPLEFAKLRSTNLEEAARLQAEVRLEFEHWLGRGYAATWLEVNERGAEYILEPWPNQ